MNHIDNLVLVKWNFNSQTESLKEQLRRTCRKHKTAFSIVSAKTPHPVLVHEAVRAKYCVIWHGSCPLSTWAIDIRKRLGLHYKVIEVGWFPQNEYWHIDSEGLCGKSSLCGELPDPTHDDYQLLEQFRENYKGAVNPDTINELNLPTDYVLCPFQVSHDSTIYYDAPYKNNQDFAQHVIEKFPNDPVVFKVHPKQTKDMVRTRREDVFTVRQGNFIDYVPQSRLVYGQTSTTLYESALIDPTKVEAIGDCPFAHHQNSVDEINKLLAVMCSRQIDRKLDTDMWKWIVN